MKRVTPIWVGLCVMMGVSVLLGQTTKPTTRPRNQSADEVLDRMLQPGGGGAQPLQPGNRPPAVDKTTGPGAVAPDAPVMQVMREGSFIVDRVGRLTRSADGSQFEFVFDSDGQAMQDPPVIVLPNSKLATMESVLADSSRDIRFRITGEVTEYRGRNYVLLQKVVVVAENDKL
jgi:hypothetical protein